MEKSELSSSGEDLLSVVFSDPSSCVPGDERQRKGGHEILL
jgi:hypothetical protein